ncbi:MAG TPA: alanine racemase [Anaeromyxobacteraceae bacterium]|nr:alanine racemase [Anaeromyxobacteraceae bacterium]
MSETAASPHGSRPPGLPPGTVTWLEIDVGALAANVRAFQGRLGGARFAAVVKSEAYGHGVALVAPAALKAGATWLAVWGANEGLPLRRLVGPGVPILCLGHTPPADFEEAVRADLRLTVYDPAAIPALSRAARAAGRVARVHLKLETGTHRQGLEPGDAAALARAAASAEGVELEGVSTHFADIEDTTDHGYAESQLAAFTQGVEDVVAAGARPSVRHTACSAAAILFPRTHFDMARVGIGLYGLWPSRETLVSARERGLSGFALSPVMSWKALVAQVKDVPQGGYVGYGRTWRAPRRTRIAVIPVGYFEGYSRALSSRAHVLLRGRRAPVLGRICMNMFMVDVTDVPGAAAGDVVTLLGRDGDEAVTAEALAGWAGTIHYEITTRVNPQLPRVPVNAPA